MLYGLGMAIKEFLDRRIQSQNEPAAGKSGEAENYEVTQGKTQLPFILGNLVGDNGLMTGEGTWGHIWRNLKSQGSGSTREQGLVLLPSFSKTEICLIPG